jgi:hypothetical protein
LSAPDISTPRGPRDRAILAVLLGCGLRRPEVAVLPFTHLQQRDGRWGIADLDHFQGFCGPALDRGVGSAIHGCRRFSSGAPAESRRYIETMKMA